MPIPRSLTDKVSSPDLIEARGQGDAGSVAAEFHCVGNQAREDPADFVRVDMNDDVVGHVGYDLDPARPAPVAERAKGFVDQLADIDLAFAQHQLAGLGATDLEHVLDDVQQPPGAAEDVADIFAVLGRRQRAEDFGVHDFGKADDGVERRPQFVAHRREEALLRAVGGEW